jgi:hypothetical protein
MQAVAMMYPSQYRKYMLAWNEAYAVNPEYFNDSGFKWLAKHAKRVGGSYKISVKIKRLFLRQRQRAGWNFLKSLNRHLFCLLLTIYAG